MNKRRFLHTVYILTTVCVITSTLLFNGCVDTETKYYTPKEYSGDNAYKTFTTIEEGVPYFSFEYPSNYHLSDQTDTWREGFGFVVLSGNVSEKEFMNGTVQDIIIDIRDVYQGFASAESSMENTIAFRKWSYQRNYRLIEKHKSILDGIEGWEILITYKLRFNKFSGYMKPPNIVNRILFFDYQDTTWKISLYTDADSYEKETKAVFEHLLQTFKFHE